MNLEQNGRIYVLIAVLFWSLVGLIVKSVNADSTWIILIRALSAAVFLSPYIKKERIFPLKNVVLSGIFMAGLLLSVTITTKNANSAMAITMQYTAPMYIIAYRFYRNKKIEYGKLAVLLCILIGVIFIIINGLRTGNPSSLISGIAVGFFFMFYSYSMRGVEGGNPLGIIAMVNFVTFLVCVGLVIMNPTPPPTSIPDIIVLILSGVFISGVSYAFYGAGLRLISIDKAMMIGLLEPILNPLWVYVGTGELPTRLTVIGVLFIMMGAVVNIVVERNKAKLIKNEMTDLRTN